MIVGILVLIASALLFPRFTRVVVLGLVGGVAVIYIAASVIG